MVKRIEHLGIAVESIEDALPMFETLFSSECYKEEVVESEGVKTAFIQVGESKIELLEATNSDSAIAKYLEKNRGGFHHVAFEVDDLDEELVRLSKEGFRLIHQTPKDGADNKRIAFLHPKSTKGLLVELCQEKTLDSI
ncbi:MAG: methylmalonyl-CoA epimerase [Crocinitomicaceae bacterium]|nr:methylmalonyl-CoA epimerase [Crocinitomicaceae bacterium]MDG1659502.1 methylmalonyl-CoA epimerase [Crocinitomicaceae bacterium]MDG2441321.1 methylmalonyl-CoA epimerase [Crocinitomicaceae bacterium]|tara:strand:- start:9673 stop:10089 length:417 start_codon:yes stop_codon:yes gene_type:complete